MSDQTTEKPSKLSGVAVLPWTVALVLFLVLLGVLAALGLGLTADPLAEPEMTEAAPALPQPDETTASEVSRETAPAPAPVAEPAAEPAPEPETMSETDRATEMVPESGGVTPETDGLEPAVSAVEAAQGVDTEAPVGETVPDTEPVTPEPAGEVAAAPPPPAATAPSVLPGSNARALPPAPAPGLVEASPQGPLPRIGPDGREPWKVYARPFDAGDERPRVAIILSGLGLSSAATEAAIQDLPSEVTLAYQPFADNIQQWIRLSRAAGHEVLLNLPMEPVDIRSNDPGPRALFVTLTPEENLDRMRWALSRVSGYVGVVNHMGSRFTVSRDAMQPVLTELKARGLLFVDARSAARSVATTLASEMQVPRAINDRFLDNREVSRATVDARLAEVESIAIEAGVSIAIGQAFPVTIERIREWADTLEEKGIALVPISAVVDRQSDR